MWDASLICPATHCSSGPPDASGDRARYRDVATAKRTMASMGIGHHWLGRYKDLFRELGKRPTIMERRARTSERHRLLIPTRIAISVAVMVLAYFLVWPMVQSVFN